MEWKLNGVNICQTKICIKSLTRKNLCNQLNQSILICIHICKRDIGNNMGYPLPILQQSPLTMIDLDPTQKNCKWLYEMFVYKKQN